MGQVSEGEESLGLCERGSVCVQRRGAVLRGLWRIPPFTGRGDPVISQFPGRNYSLAGCPGGRQ